MQSFPSIYELQCPALTRLPQLALAAETPWCDLTSQLLKAERMHRALSHILRTTQHLRSTGQAKEVICLINEIASKTE